MCQALVHRRRSGCVPHLGVGEHDAVEFLDEGVLGSVISDHGGVVGLGMPLRDPLHGSLYGLIGVSGLRGVLDLHGHHPDADLCAESENDFEQCCVC